MTEQKTIQNAAGYTVPFVTDETAREVLQRLLSGRSITGDFYILEGIDARLGDFPSDVFEMRWQFLENSIYEMAGDDFFDRMQKELAASEIVPPSKEELAAEKARDIFTVIHALEGTLKRKGLIARELWRRGYTMKQMLDAGLNRGTVGDARQVVRAEYVKRGEKIPETMKINAIGRWDRGSDRRNSTGPQALESAEASRLLSQVAPMLAEPKKGRTKAFSNGVEAFGSNAISDNFEDGETE